LRTADATVLSLRWGSRSHRSPRWLSPAFSRRQE
jgi:hypothetical protein